METYYFQHETTLYQCVAPTEEIAKVTAYETICPKKESRPFFFWKDNYIEDKELLYVGDFDDRNQLVNCNYENFFEDFVQQIYKCLDTVQKV
jgi:hypothetical protein